MQKSRTANSIRNSAVVIICKMISIVFSFVTRTVFINFLGKNILGIEGLFTNIITILNLADLGLSTAVIFLMYKPIAEGNDKKTSAILNYLNRFYFIIGFVVIGIGLAITPVIPHLVNLETQIDHLYLYYILTIVSTGTSYFFASRRCIFEASQNSYIVTIIDAIVSIISSIVKLSILILTRNYALYLVVTIVINFCSNLFIYFYGNKKFTYLKQYSKEKLNDNEKKDLFKNVGAVVSHKVGSVLVNGTDNLLISVLLSTILVGIYSNYLMVINIIMGLVTIAISAITPSIGNLKETSTDIENDYKVFKLINFVTYWMVSVTAICLFCLLNPFISAWLDNTYLFDWTTVLLLCGNYYISSMRHSVGVFATAAGYFKKTWYKPYMEGIINLVASIVLAKLIGINGIFLGTTFSLLLGSFWVDPIVTFKHWFKKSPAKYFLGYILEFLIVILLGLSCYFAVKYINLNVNEWVEFGLKCLICFSVANVGMLLISIKNPQLKLLIKKLKNRQ